jgi:hypothetical protein
MMCELWARFIWYSVGTLMKRRVVIVSLLVVTMASFVVAQEKTKDAQAAAEAWLQLVDSGNYAQSWQEAASMFKTAITERDWEQKLKASRAPLGALVFRKLKSADYTTSLPGVPDGQYVVIRYDSSFANKKSAIETVTPMLDQGGQWRVSGYFIK